MSHSGAALAGAVLLTVGSVARAAPSGSVDGWAAFGEQGKDGLSGGGLGAALGLPLSQRLSLDLRAEAGVGGLPSGVAPWLAARPELRIFLTPPEAPRAALSASIGAGLRWSDTLHPDIALGAAFDLPGRGTLAPRLQARYLLDPTGGGSTLLLSAGFAWPRPQPPPPPEPLLEPLADTPAPPQAASYLWVPHPIASCVLATQVQMLGAAPPQPAPTTTDSAAAVAAPLAAPLASVEVPAPLDLEALLNPSQGSLVIAAQPGDVVEVGDALVPTGSDWTTVTTAAPGPIEVTIRGAGKVQHLRPSIAAGFAVWMRSTTTLVPHRLTFASGSSTLSESDLVWLATLVDNAGTYTFQLEGTYSPEGNLTVNQRIAQQRATATRDALLAAGLDPGQVQLLPTPLSADPELSTEDQRACLIIPVPPQPTAPAQGDSSP